MTEQYLQELTEAGNVRFYVRVKPGAAQTGMVSKMDDGSIKIDIKELPENGRANMELIRYLSEIFGVSKKNVQIVSGTTSRHKLVQVRR